MMVLKHLCLVVAAGHIIKISSIYMYITYTGECDCKITKLMGKFRYRYSAGSHYAEVITSLLLLLEVDYR